MIGLALTLALAAAKVPDPLAPAWAGKVQCYTPDATRKTCVSIGAYARQPGGLIENRAVVLVSKSPLIVMETRTHVTVKGPLICGPIIQHDIDIATFTVNGAAATPQQTDRLRAGLIQQMTPLFGHEDCTTYEAVGDHLVAHVTDNGKPQPPDMIVTWVSEADYKVAP